jgi:hypothetical protein
MIISRVLDCDRNGKPGSGPGEFDLPTTMILMDTFMLQKEAMNVFKK